jgi:hypothetical protein
MIAGLFRAAAVRAAGYPHPPLRGTLSRSRERDGVRATRAPRVHQ